MFLPQLVTAKKLCSVSTRCPVLDIAYQGNNITCILLRLASQIFKPESIKQLYAT